ncbi:MAG TPA: site-specific integrase [Solirubrobacteraceae bacterium]
MSYSFAKGAWEVRWRDSNDRQRSRRFKEEEPAQAFDEALNGVEPDERRENKAGYGSQSNVYPYETARGTRWRYVTRRSDGKQTSKRGFTSPRAAREAARRITERVQRGELRHTKHTFGTWWETWLPSRKPYLEPNAWRAYEVDGRKRLLPAFGELPMEKFETDHVRAWMETCAEAVAEEEIAAKTINNTLGTLVVCLNAAVKERIISSNPALGVERLPAAHIERDYLRLHEIPNYLDSCLDIYRPLAEVLIGAGPRISEALGVRINDLELEKTGGVIVVYRSRKRSATGKTVSGSTKGDKFHPIEIGPGLSQTLQDHLAYRATMPFGDQPTAPVFVMPTRVRKRDRGRWASTGAPEPIDRSTVSSDWHKAALQDAAIRDMPLHSLRHTAAAAWLAAGNSLMYVQRQLDHSDIATTQRYYGHLERHVLAEGARNTELAIKRATKRNTSRASKRAA